MGAGGTNEILIVPVPKGLFKTETWSDFVVTSGSQSVFIPYLQNDKLNVIPENRSLSDFSLKGQGVEKPGVRKRQRGSFTSPSPV